MTFDDIENKLVRAVTEVMEFLRLELIKELENQGHVLTGKTIASINYDVQVTSEGIVARMMGNENALRLDTGVSAATVRGMYAPRTGRGGTSDYIQGLIDYFEDRGLGSEAKRAAFATANIAYDTGHPTPGSSRFASQAGGRRTGYIRHTLESNVPKVRDMLTKDAKIAIEGIIQDYTKRWNKEFKS
jgi:hypothetical protein